MHYLNQFLAKLPQLSSAQRQVLSSAPRWLAANIWHSLGHRSPAWTCGWRATDAHTNTLLAAAGLAPIAPSTLTFMHKKVTCRIVDAGNPRPIKITMNRFGTSLAAFHAGTTDAAMTRPDGACRVTESLVALGHVMNVAVHRCDTLAGPAATVVSYLGAVRAPRQLRGAIPRAMLHAPEQPVVVQRAPFAPRALPQQKQRPQRYVISA